MSPVDEKALLQQGIAAARAGDKASARARFRELTAHNFDNELAWLWLASVADTPAHAIACLRRVLQINPAHDKARAALFRVLMEGGIQTARGGDKATAFASFSECATIDASNELVWTWMASTAPTQAQALDALRRVLHINPAHEQAGRAYKKLVVQRGIDLAQAGDADARVVLLEASAADPENESVWLWLARSVTPEESIECYERVLELNPANTIAISALQELRPQPSITSASHAPTLSDEPDLDLPEMFGGPANARMDTVDADTDGMVVEQFRKDGASAQLTAATQAATQEEFLVYTNAESVEVWAPPGTGAGVTEEESATTFEAESGQDDSGTLDVNDVDEQTLEVAVAQMEISVAEQDAMELSLAPAASPSGQLSDVDSYVAGAESTYASSARVAAGQPRFTPPAIEEEDPEIAAAEMALRAMADEQAAAEAAAAEAAAAEAAAQEAAAEAAAASAAAMPEPVAAPPAPAASNEPNAWDCPICLSGAPQSASRCPNCGSVVSLLDPDLLLETEPVDRRHVLQVVARLKSRKVSGTKQQFDHHFTLGLAFVNAGRTTEGLQQLRAAAALRKTDNDLKAQIDTLERRAAQREEREREAGRGAARARHEGERDRDEDARAARRSAGRAGGRRRRSRGGIDDVSRIEWEWRPPDHPGGRRQSDDPEGGVRHAGSARPRGGDRLGRHGSAGQAEDAAAGPGAAGYHHAAHGRLSVVPHPAIERADEAGADRDAVGQGRLVRQDARPHGRGRHLHHQAVRAIGVAAAGREMLQAGVER